MTVRLYASTDASAPVLTGQAGKLTDLLDAILVNGYGSKTAAGWTINKTTTNKRGYLQNTTGSNNSAGMLLYVDDASPGAGAAKEARVCGFETMSAITPVGTGQFPTGAQSAIGSGQLVVRKSNTADATARPWTCIANGQCVYLFIETGDHAAGPTFAAFPFIFGDFFSYKTSDQYAVQIVARTAENSASANVDWFSTLPPDDNGSATTGDANANNSTVCQGHYLARSWTGVGGSVKFGKAVDQGKVRLSSKTNATPNGMCGGSSSTRSAMTTTISFGVGRNTNADFPYPNGPDGAVWLSPIWIVHNGAVRGYFKGLWAPLHDRPLNHNDTYSVSSGNLNGKSMVVQSIPTFIANAEDQGQVHIEYSDTWT